LYLTAPNLVKLAQMVRDSRKSRQKSGKNTAYFEKNREKHGKNTASKYDEPRWM